MAFRNSYLTRVERDVTNDEVVLTNDNAFVETKDSVSYLSLCLKVSVYILFTLIGGFSWFFLPSSLYIPLLIGAIVVLLFSSLLIAFVPSSVKVAGALYALSEGLLLGLVILTLNTFNGFRGIGLFSVLATAIIFIVTLLMYMSKMIKASAKSRKMIFIGLISMILLSIIFGILQMVTGGNYDIVILLISAVYVIIGVFMLVEQFEQAQSIINHNAPKKYEWYVAFGLFSTILFIFINILRILMIVMKRR